MGGRLLEGPSSPAVTFCKAFRTTVLSCDVLQTWLKGLPPLGRYKTNGTAGNSGGAINHLCCVLAQDQLADFSEPEAHAAGDGEVVGVKIAVGDAAIRHRVHDADVGIPLRQEPPVESRREDVHRAGAIPVEGRNGAKSTVHRVGFLPFEIVGADEIQISGDAVFEAGPRVLEDLGRASTTSSTATGIESVIVDRRAVKAGGTTGVGRIGINEQEAVIAERSLRIAWIRQLDPLIAGVKGERDTGRSGRHRRCFAHDRRRVPPRTEAISGLRHEARVVGERRLEVRCPDPGAQACCSVCTPACRPNIHRVSHIHADDIQREYAGTQVLDVPAGFSCDRAVIRVIRIVPAVTASDRLPLNRKVEVADIDAILDRGGPARFFGAAAAGHLAGIADQREGIRGRKRIVAAERVIVEVVLPAEGHRAINWLAEADDIRRRQPSPAAQVVR